MNRPRKIDFSVLKKNSSGVYGIPLSDLADLRFTEIPFYSTVEIEDLPGELDTYKLGISATHAGGPNNEEFSLFIHVQFNIPGDEEDEAAIRRAKRKTAHIRRFFSSTSRTLGLGDGRGWAPYIVGNSCLLGDVLFSRYFTRDDNPILSDIIGPFVERFNAFLASGELLLFICHASEDKLFVDVLCDFLDRQKVPVWYDRREIKVGESIVQRIDQGLDEASHVLVVLSGSSVEKPWVRKEISSTLMRQLGKTSVQILPLVIDECTIPPLLADIKFADCRSEYERGFREVLEAIL